MVVPCPSILKMFRRSFCFACIVTWENDKDLNFFSKRYPMKRSTKESILTCSDSFSRWLKVMMFETLLPRILKRFQHFLVLYISGLAKNDKDLIFFPEDAPWKALQNLYKKDRNQLVTTVFSYSKLTAYLVVPLPSIMKILFHFAYISTWKNDKDLIFFPKDAPWKALQNLYKKDRNQLVTTVFSYSKWTASVIVPLLA
jgi:uncharacterized membrane protein